VLASQLETFVRVKLARADLALFLVEPADLFQRLCRQLGLEAWTTPLI
jgi:hypothetical protein